MHTTLASECQNDNIPSALGITFSGVDNFAVVLSTTVGLHTG